MDGKKLYLITATTKTEGLVLSEVFENLDDALDFETNGVDGQLRSEYGNKMADCDSLSIGFGPLTLHVNSK